MGDLEKRVGLVNCLGVCVQELKLIVSWWSVQLALELLIDDGFGLLLKKMKKVDVNDGTGYESLRQFFCELWGL